MKSGGWMGSTSKILFQNLFMYARYCSARKIDVLDMEDTINKSLSPDQLQLKWTAASKQAPEWCVKKTVRNKMAGCIFPTMKQSNQNNASKVAISMHNVVALLVLG